MLVFLFPFFTPGALSPAPNIIDIILKVSEESEEGEVERKRVINICVCGLLLLIIGLFGGITGYVDIYLCHLVVVI